MCIDRTHVWTLDYRPINVKLDPLLCSSLVLVMVGLSCTEVDVARRLPKINQKKTEQDRMATWLLTIRCMERVEVMIEKADLERAIIFPRAEAVMPLTGNNM
jgi:hypothetical protein